MAPCIASDTLVDNSALEHAFPIPYLEVVFACTAVVCLAGALLRFFGSYALALAALALAPAATVAAVRESSIGGAVAIAGASPRSRWPDGGLIVPPARLELAPRGLKGRRSDQLSYGGPLMLERSPV